MRHASERKKPLLLWKLPTLFIGLSNALNLLIGEAESNISSISKQKRKLELIVHWYLMFVSAQ